MEEHKHWYGTGDSIRFQRWLELGTNDLTNKKQKFYNTTVEYILHLEKRRML